MKATKAYYITEAYTELGLGEYVFDLSVEQMSSALRRLEAMMADWNSKGIRVNWTIPSSVDGSSPDDEVLVPDSASEAIIYNLALRLASGIGKVASVDTKVIASRSYNSLIANKKPLERQYPSMVPAGAGHKIVPGKTFLDGPSDNLGEKPQDTMEFES